jgi:hypothetical protein
LEHYSQSLSIRVVVNKICKPLVNVIALYGNVQGELLLQLNVLLLSELHIELKALDLSLSILQKLDEF